MAKTSKLAKASLILGIGSVSALLLSVILGKLGFYNLQAACFILFLLLGLPAFLSGLVSRIIIACSRGELEGAALSRGGMALGVLAVLCVLVYQLVLCSYRRRAKRNESSAIKSLKAIAAQQAIFKARCEIDQDGDGEGEYGFLCELAGEIVPRKKNATTPISPRYVCRGFDTGGSTGMGIAEKSGYCFRIYLMGKEGKATDDSVCDGSASKPSTPLDPKVDQKAIDMQEGHFVLYAWPHCHSCGSRCFAVNELGHVYETKMANQTYSSVEGWRTHGPSMEAAFSAKADGSDGWLNDKLADGKDDPGNDGNVWVRVE